MLWLEIHCHFLPGRATTEERELMSGNESLSDVLLLLLLLFMTKRLKAL